MKRVTKELRETALHEAGHAVVAHLLDWTPLNLDLTPRGDVGGSVQFHKNRKMYMRAGVSGPDLTGADRRSIVKDLYVTLAGGAAVGESGGWGGDCQDWKDADFVLSCLYPSLTSRQRRDRLYSLWFQVKEVLHRRSVHTVLLRVQRVLLKEFARTGKRRWSRSELQSILRDASTVRVTGRLNYASHRLPVLDSYFSHVGR